MKVIPTTLSGSFVIEPDVFEDARGFFMESFNAKTYGDALGQKLDFVQDNHSRSTRGVLRGLHYQAENAQGKLVRVVKGTVFDVEVDLRRGSPSFGKWSGVELSEENRRELWIPEGFAHGFLVLSDVADFLYKTTDYYAPQHERCIKWDDSDLGVNWPLGQISPIVSPKDAGGSGFKEACRELVEKSQYRYEANNNL